MILQSNPAWFSLLVGEPVEEKATASADSEANDGTSPYRFVAPGMQCMTSYITDRAPDTLDKLIVSGVSKSILDLEELNKDRHHLVEELLLPKGSLFSKGWVQDLDKGTKRKVHLSQQRKDEAPTSSSHAIKKAYFGMPRSGSLTFFIPLSKGQERAEAELLSKGFVSARGYIETVTLCEADQPEYKDTEDTCRLSRDANIVLGDEVASPEPLPADVSLYCATIHVPDHSNLAFKHDVVQKTTKQKKKTGKASPQEDSVSEKPEIGLSIEISVRSIRGTFREPCSIAHVLWNEVDQDD
ncbi:expressed unknown protein [Seminavis robusta]|uniref:Uncharacterized protein n=1 Tax=Seminavis robusta TaxID=568900 RepID=A0A9N8DUG0_9STRA|nr:expressed unknown protein [Seminavis robusta]|eukprot:Sro289_g108970.1 n/a (298) ;mRNA; f:8487-9380